jgi:hypothetical protein
MNLRAAASLAVAFALAGCRGCHEGHPYVPYAVESAPPARAGDAGLPPATASAAIADAGRTAFVLVPATVAPPGASGWTVDGVTLMAPEGQIIVSALVRDFDGDGTKDAFAIVRANEGNDPGELAYYRGLEHADALQAAALFAPPESSARDPSCGLVDRLAAVGPRSVLAELGTTACPAHGSITPDRWVAVVRGGAQAKVQLALTIVDPPGAAVLSVDADTVDRDGDGLDDVALRVTLEGGGPVEPGPRVGAIFAWLDRPAGLSRDVGATESSFASLAATAAARAARHKDAAAVPLYAAQVRALWRAVCADGGSPRVIGVGTGPIACGVGRALESLGVAEVHAYATAGDPLRAALALDRVARSSSARPAAHLSEAQKWMAQLAPVAGALALRAVSAVPIVNGGRDLAWGSLAFEPSGKLLVRTRAGVVRVDPDAGDEAAADGVADWKSAVTSPDGAMRWIETYDPCDGLSLRAALAPTNVDELHEVALPVAPLGERCVGSRGARASTIPLAWGAGGIEAIVEGEPVLISPDLAHASLLGAPFGEPAAPGGPRSPDGTILVVPTVAGLLVRSATHARLFRAPELDGTYGDQRDCAVSNGATHVACVRAGRAWVGAWEGF